MINLLNALHEMVDEAKTLSAVKDASELVASYSDMVEEEKCTPAERSTLDSKMNTIINLLNIRRKHAKSGRKDY